MIATDDQRAHLKNYRNLLEHEVAYASARLAYANVIASYFRGNGSATFSTETGDFDALQTAAANAVTQAKQDLADLIAWVDANTPKEEA